MKHKSIRLFLGLSGIVTALAFTFNTALAANHGNYKNQNSTQTISEDVADLVSGTKGKMQVYADHDDAVDVYMSFDDYKKAMELNAEQIDANTENIATESDIYSSSKTYKQGGLCIKDGSLYQCTSEITTPEAWNASHWKKISLSDAFNSLNKDLIETKKSVSDGKSAIASAITEMGVSTESDATFETIVNNINSISNKKTVVNLGRSSTYSVTSYPGYQNFTVANNFLVGTYSASASSRWDDDSGNWSRSCSSSTNQTVSYNASTGVLTVKINRSNGSKSDHVGEISGSISGNQPNVWLVY